MIFLVCLSLLGYCFALRRFSKWPIEYAPFFVVSLSVVTLYCFAYFGMLKSGSTGILAVGWLFLLVSPLFIFKERKEIFHKYLTAGFLVSSALTAIFMALSHELHFSGWDEFTHWGPHSKLVFIYDGLIKASDSTIHKTYPLGGSLFQYLFFRLTGYSEGVAYVAQCLLTMAPLSVLLGRYEWQSWRKAIIAYAFALSILLILKIQIGPVGTLYMDGIVGIYFGMLLAAYLFSERKLIDIYYLIPAMMALVSFKVGLMPLVLLTAVIILIDQLMKDRQSILLKLIAVLILTLSAAGMIYGWNTYLAHIGAIKEWEIHFTTTLDATQYQILKGYLIHLTKSLPFIAIVFFLNMVAGYCYQTKIQRKKLIIVNILLLSGFVAYAAGLLLMYLFSFTTYEAIHHASMSRYLNIYYVGWSLVTLSFLYDSTRALSFKYNKTLENVLVFGFIAGIASLLWMHHIHQKNPLHQLYSVWTQRQPTIKISEAVKAVTESQSKVFTLWQASAGFERGMIVYELTPRKPNMGCITVGSPYDKEDIWTCPLTTKQFVNEIKTFDYLLLAYVDKNFWTHYQSLFQQSKLTPLVTYQICQGEKFDEFGRPGCRMRTHHAYLFKIVNQHHKLLLKNMKG